jgi:DNA-binding NtrC family response regulator
MKQKVRVLVVDDEASVLESLKISFESSKKFDFDFKSAVSPEECICLDEIDFDLCILDLGFNADSAEELVGFRMLCGNSCIRKGGLAIVYTGFPDIENVVRAMKWGASDFVSKADYAPHELVERVEKLLFEMASSALQEALVSRYVRTSCQDLDHDYPNQVVAIIVENGVPIVAAAGTSRLDSLLNYAKLRRNGKQKTWPVLPHLHFTTKAQ